MKTISKIALCGLVAFALQSVANAQSLQVEQKLVNTLEQNQITKRFLEDKLGVKTGVAADVNAALSKLTPAEQAGVYAALTAYATRASAPNNATLKNLNNKLAASIFQKQGQMIEVAALAKNSSSRSSVTETKQNACSTDSLDKAAMALSVDGSGVTYAQALDALKKGAIKVDTQNCDTPAAQMDSPKAKGNLVKIANCATDRGSFNNDTYAACYAQAAGIDKAQALDLISQEQTKCAYLR